MWWDEIEDERWHMLLRCAQCETYCEIEVTDDLAKAYERDLQRGMAVIAASLDRCERERMATEVDVFIAALERDLIDAADFASR